MKVCRKCGVEKSLDAFSKDSHAKDGKQPVCKLCQSIRMKAHAHPAKSEGTKFCRKCSTEKSITDFSKNKRLSDGRDSQCKQCVRKRGAAHYIKNKAHYRARNKAWILAHPERSKEYYREWRDANRDKLSYYGKHWYWNNRERALAEDKAARDANIEKFLARERASYVRNAASRKLKEQRWYKNNPDKICAQAAKRRAAKLQRTPSWLTKEHFEEIDAFYKQAEILRKLTGEDWHVDHKVPLRGKKVSGLHVPWNLQLLPANENLRKTNKHEP